MLGLILIAIVQFRLPLVTVVNPVQGEALQVVYATGTVEARTMLPLAARATGHLQEILKDEGAFVAKGEILARLHDPELQAALEEALAHEKYTLKEQVRSQRLLKKNAVSIQEQQRAEAEWEASVAARKRIEAQLGFLEFRSPDTCLVIRRDGEIGQLLSLNTIVFWLQCGKELRITAEVDEEDIVFVAPGQEVLIRSDAYPDLIVRGQVSSVTPKGDPIARSYRVRISFIERHSLKIGMTVEANIITQKKDRATLLPVSAVHEGYIQIVRDSLVTQKKIKTGISGLQQLEVVTELDSKEEVITPYDRGLTGGMRVRTQALTDQKQ